MRKIILIITLSLVFQKLSYSQNVCEVFSTHEINWYGLDFSCAKLVGTGFNDPQAIKDKFIPDWNNLVIKEAKKYNIKKFFRKKSVQYKLDIVTERNNKIDFNKLVSLNSIDNTDVDEQKISNAILEYNTGSDAGIGLVFFIEAFDKYKDRAIISVVFFDIASKKVFIVKRLKGEAKGVGLRNYWASSIYRVMLQCYKNLGKWKKEYCIK